MSSTYLVRSTPSETFNKLTVSCWFKGMADGTQRNFWGLYDNTDSNRFFGLYYSSNGSLYAYWKQDGSLQFTLGTMQKFRDPSSWYHFVMTMDTTLATASDRVKFYLNGQRITVFEDPLETITQSKNVDLMNGTTDGRMQWGGGKISGTQYYWNGSMSHCHMCVGYAYDASSFGSTDATTGEWKINTSPSVSYGTNGGFWLKDGNQLTDSSTNSNTLTVGGGTLTKTEDNPSNVFATFNPLLDVNAKPTLSNGNTTMAGAAISSAQFVGSTICVSSGKWYYEIKVTPNSSSPYVGVIDAQSNLRRGAVYFVNAASGDNDSGYAVNMSGDIYHNNSNSYATNIGSISSGDILGFAIDLDSAQRTCEIYKNGVSQRSFNLAEPSSGAYMLACCSSYNTASASVNFGNGYFGTTAVATNSGNGYQDADGNGIMNYSVPANYRCLCTKGLNQ